MIRKPIHTRLAALAFVALGPSTTVCGRPPQEPPALPLGVDSKPAPGVDPGVAREAHGSADPADVLFVRARRLPLPPSEMEAVVALTDEHDRSEAAASAAFRVYRVELARQVRAGGIDMVMLGPGREAAVNALKAHLDDEISVIDRLHALLRPEERAALVAELRSEGVRLTSAEEPRGASAQRERLERIAAHFGDPVFSAQSALALPGQSPVDAARTRLRDQATRASELVPTLTQGQRNKLGAQIESTLDEEEE